MSLIRLLSLTHSLQSHMQTDTFQDVREKVDSLLGLTRVLGDRLLRCVSPDAFPKDSLCEMASLRLLENMWAECPPPSTECSFSSVLQIRCGIDADLASRIRETRRLHVRLHQTFDLLDGKKDPPNSGYLAKPER